MKEIIKYETDENGENSRLMSMASGDTTMKVIARLLLQMAKDDKGRSPGRHDAGHAERGLYPRNDR